MGDFKYACNLLVHPYASWNNGPMLKRFLTTVRRLAAEPRGRLILGVAVAWTLVIAAGLFFRIYDLGFPHKQVFDEVYFPVMAKQYLHGVDVYDVHPPLGKFVIAAAIYLFGDTTIGWRIMPLVFGIGIIWLMGRLYLQAFKDKVGALIVTAFFAMDGLFIVYSRTGLMDGILFFAIFLCVFLALRARSRTGDVLVGIAAGLALAIKWPALAVLLVFFIIADQKKWNGRRFLVIVPIMLVVYFLIVVAGEWLDKAANPVMSALYWHESAFRYHATITATHPWGSTWWTWPLLLRPVLFLYDTTSDGKAQIITTLGNPFLWWTSVISILGTTLWVGWQAFVKKAYGIWQHPVLPFLVGYYAFWLPWAEIHRVVFLYHYIPSYGFALIILAYWLSQLWRKAPYLVLCFMAIAIACSAFYLPLSLGWMSLTESQIKARITVNSWLY